VERVLSGIVCVRGPCLEHLKHQLDAGERLPDLVMQFACHTASLGLLHLEHTLGEALQQAAGNGKLECALLDALF
jgi:hypothetical protein